MFLTSVGCDELKDVTDGASNTGSTDTVSCDSISSEEECLAADGCAPLHGARLVIKEGSGFLCQSEQRYIECAPARECTEGEQLFCHTEGSDATDYIMINNGCGPDGYTECDYPEEFEGVCDG